MGKKEVIKASDDLHALIYKTIIDPQSEFKKTIDMLAERVGIVMMVGGKVEEAGIGIFVAQGDQSSMVLAVRNAIHEDKNETLMNLLAMAMASEVDSKLREASDDIRRN